MKFKWASSWEFVKYFIWEQFFLFSITDSSVINKKTEYHLDQHLLFVIHLSDQCWLLLFFRFFFVYLKSGLNRMHSGYAKEYSQSAFIEELRAT